MTRSAALFFRALLACAILLAAPPAFARAADRPNALDRIVTRMPAAHLLTTAPDVLVDADRQAAAARFVGWSGPGWLLGVLFEAGALLWFWRSGGAARWRDRLRGRLKREALVRPIFGASLAAIAKCAALPAYFYEYRVTRVMELSTQRAPSWVFDWFVQMLAAMLVMAIVCTVVLWLVDRTRLWYVYTAASVVAVYLLIAWMNPAVFAPVMTRFSTIAFDTSLETRVAALTQRAGFSNIPIYVEARAARSTADIAYADGIGATRRAIVSDTMLAAATPGEVVFALAHDFGMFAVNAIERRALMDALLVIVGAALAVFVADRVGFRRDDDALSRLAMVGALLAIFYLVVEPGDAWYSRKLDAEANAYALRMSGDRAAAVRLAVRTADQSLESVCPGWFERVFLLHTQSIAQRIADAGGVRAACVSSGADAAKN